MADDPNEIIKMYHPELAGDEVATTTQEAFDSVWSAKGWKQASDKDLERFDQVQADALNEERIGTAPRSGKTK